MRRSWKRLEKKTERINSCHHNERLFSILAVALFHLTSDIRDIFLEICFIYLFIYFILFYFYFYFFFFGGGLLNMILLLFLLIHLLLFF